MENITFSSREHQVLVGAAAGLTDKEIAHHLNISIRTVGTYWERIRAKTGVHGRVRAVIEGLGPNLHNPLLHSSSSHDLSSLTLPTMDTGEPDPIRVQVESIGLDFKQLLTAAVETAGGEMKLSSDEIQEIGRSFDLFLIEIDGALVIKTRSNQSPYPTNWEYKTVPKSYSEMGAKSGPQTCGPSERKL